MISIWETTQIKQAREEAAMLVKTASEALNITPEYLSMLENGHRQPSQKLISKMSELYGKPVTFFLKSEKKDENLAFT